MVDETILFDHLSTQLQNFAKVIVIGDIKQRDYYLNVLPLLIQSEFYFYADYLMGGKLPFKQNSDETVYLLDNYSIGNQSDPISIDFVKSNVETINFQESDRSREIELFIINDDATVVRKTVYLDNIPLKSNELTTVRGKVIIDIEYTNVISNELIVEEIYKQVTTELSLQIRKLLNFKDRDAKKLITYFAFFVLDTIDPRQKIDESSLKKLDKEKLNRYLGFQNLDKYTNQLFQLFTSAIVKGIDLYNSRVKKVDDSSVLEKLTSRDFSIDSKGNVFLSIQKEKYLIRNGDEYPMIVNEYIVASCIRYHYMDLGSIGLATMYKSMGYIPEDDVLESFSSVLNRYFNNYCSAFTDVDVDSKGNFFKLEKVEQSIMVVNPPFEISIMSDAFKKCRELYKNNPNLTCHFIIPDWKDWPELDQLEKDSFKVMRFGKDDKTFIDYEARKEIHPCPVVYCYFGKERIIDSNGKIERKEYMEEKEEIEEKELDLFEMLRFEKLLYKF